MSIKLLICSKVNSSVLVYLDSEMDSDLNVSIMFLKPLIFFPRGTLPERLRLPRGFVDHFGESLPELLNLKTMEGFNFSVKYSNEDGCISDMHGLLSNLLPKEFQFMLFKYLGGANFEVFILDVGCVLQGIPGRNNSFQCMFIRIFGKDSSEWTPLKLSEDFIDKFGNQVPSGIRYLLTDGTLVSGSFDSGNGTIRGLQKVYRFYNVSIFDIMVFTYTGGDVFAVHGFGKHCMPKRSFKDPGLYFEVEIKQSHLQDYDFGVTVPVKFKSATKNIGEAGTLKIQHGERRWNVVLKKRTNRVELHRGWSVLWKDLDLMTGDICVFNNADFLKLNPLGYVPVLVDGETTLADSFAILMYLEEKYPQYPLLPEDPNKRAINYQAANIVCSSIQPFQNLAVLKYIDENVGSGESIHWALTHINKGFAALEKLLAKYAGKYATGDEVFLADLFLAPQIQGSITRFNIDMTSYPLLLRVYKAYEELSAFQDAMPEKQPDAPKDIKE